MNQQSHISARSHRMCRWSQITAVLVAAFMLAAPSVAHGATVNAAAKMAGHTSSARLAAAVALPSCPASTFCSFQNANYNANGGTRWNFAYSSYPHGTWFWIGAAANDQISSFYNHRVWTTYAARNCPANKPDWSQAPGYGYNANLSNTVWPSLNIVNDSISALAFGTSTSTNTWPASGSC